MNKIRRAFDSFRNDNMSTDGRLVLLTQIILIFFLTTLSLTSASVQQYLNENLSNMLGADVTMSGPRPLSSQDEMTLSGMTTSFAKTQTIPLTITRDEQSIRVQLKVVDNSYPLQGSLKIGNEQSDSFEKASQQGPDAGHIWLGTRAQRDLRAKIGDDIEIGGTVLRFSAVIYHEPDRIMEGHSVAMRAMVHVQSLADANLTSSNMRYRYLIAASSAQHKNIEAWANDTLKEFVVITKTNGRHPLSLFWQRTENFLGLASVILFFMAAIAIDMANRRQLDRQKQRLALYLSFGETLSSCLRLSLMQWLIGFFASFVAALILAYIAQYFLIGQLAGQFPGMTWGWHPIILIKSAGLIFLLLFAFQVPMFWQLTRTSLVSLIRSVEYPSAQLIRIFWSFASIALLAAYYSDNFMLTGLTLGALGAALLLMIVLTWIILSVGEYWGRHRPGLLSFNFFIMKKRILSKSSQILGLGLCSLLLLFTLMLMKDIGTSMAGYARVNDGNLLIAELQSEQRSVIEKWAEANKSQIRQLRPYTSAKLAQINGIDLNQAIITPSDSLATVKAPIRLSWSQQIPSNNQLAEGKWWSSIDENWRQISLETEVMSDLKLKLGDKLTFVIAGKPVTFKLVATHAFKPGNGSVTFWFQVPEKAYQAIEPEVFYMGSMELPDAAWKNLNTLWKRYPTLSLVPLKEIAKRFDNILAIVTKLIVGFATMVLIMAALVIAASMKGFESEDRQKNGLLLSMGISKTDCLKLNLYDWLTVSIISGVGAIAGTWIAGLLIYQSQFSLTYKPAPLWLIGTMVGICFTVCAVGLLFSRKSLSISINNLLRG